ncbi:MAG: cupin [Ktedonobacteraceae bacterium]|nr:cupin [Ktedonobacteraceae bacterium]
MYIIRWHKQEAPQEHDLCRQMQEQGLVPYSWSNSPGERYTVHSHNYQKVLYCVRGSIRFILPDVEGDAGMLNLAPGDCMTLPAYTRHSAEVGPQGVTCFEAAQH